MKDRLYWCDECHKEVREPSATWRRVYRGVIIESRNDSRWRDAKATPYCSSNHPVKLIALTKSRCPICREDGTGRDYNTQGRFTFRLEDRPCAACQRDLEALGQAKKDLDELTSGMVPYQVFLTPGVKLGGAHLWDQARATESAWQKLVTTLGVTHEMSRWDPETAKLPMLPRTGNGRNDRNGGVVLKFRPEVAAALSDLWEAWSSMPTEVWNQGIQQGSDLLFQMASGQLTADQFNRNVTDSLRGKK